jgi:hypothetical protein
LARVSRKQNIWKVIGKETILGDLKELRRDVEDQLTAHDAEGDPDIFRIGRAIISMDIETRRILDLIRIPWDKCCKGRGGEEVEGYLDQC